ALSIPALKYGDLRADFIKAAKQNKKISLLGIYLCDANSGGLDENEIQFFERIVKDGKKDGRKWVLRYPKTI
ncbi:hypothetical protein, partial [Lactobacillus intestinalis]|uniref:hypothetical protein n=1 Tax=Lactobacillus intestinalis TaxID=151781 RepID=UPI0026EACDE9